MKLELKKNMYYRTYSGFINKIISIKDFNEREYLLNGFYTNKDIIKKTSYNIIDILEVGDYVNGIEIIKIYEKGDSFTGNHNYIFKEKTIEVANDNYETIPYEALFINKEIEAVVTHEQMEQMAYKVGE